MADRKLSATITIGGSVDSSLGKAFGALTKGAKGVGAELKAISQQTKELEKMVKELKAAGKSTADLEKRLAALYRTQAATRARQGRLRAIGGMLSPEGGSGFQLGTFGSAIARGLASSSTFGPATVSTLTAVGAAAPFVAATATAVAAVAAAGVAATAAVVALGKSVDDFIGDTEEMADGLGVSVNNLLGLQFAAAQSGIEAEKLNEKLGKLTLSLQTAKDGTGPTAEALQELGLSFEELSVMNPEQQVLSLAQAFKTYNGNVPKLSLATAFFGKGSARFVNMLNQGRDGLKGMMADARNVGYTITTEQQEASAKFGSAWEKATMSFKAVWLEIGARTLPVITQWMDKITAWFQNPATKQGLTSFGDALLPVLKTLGDNLPMLLGVMDKWLWVMTKILQAFEGIASFSRTVGEAMGGFFFDQSAPANPVPGNAFRSSNFQPVAPGTVKSMTRQSVPATPEVLRKTAPASGGKGFGPSSSAPAPAAAGPVYNFTVNGATGQNTQDLMEEIRRYLRDTQPHHVGAY